MADLSDEALRKVYDDAAMNAYAVTGFDYQADKAGIRAVAEYAARAQRDMEPTEGMLSDGSHAAFGNRAASGKSALRDAYRAMQRAAPLVTEAKP